MSEGYYGVAIVALLPLTAGMVVLQTNPYHALVIRGILGAVAALVYALLGAADVALTEALVGTMLSITLYAVAVRSSLRLRLGISLEEGHSEERAEAIAAIRKIANAHHLRLELVTHATIGDLKAALAAKELHGILYDFPQDSDISSACYLELRLQRLYDLLRSASLPERVHLVRTSLRAGEIRDMQNPTSSVEVSP